jgi:DNA polymerase I-like protein with 3'-5' exonuclease and polymerase domains
MQIALHNSVLGSEKHLIWDGNVFAWTRHLSADDWVFGDTQHFKSLDLLCEATKRSLTFPCDVHRNVWDQIPGVDSFKIKWYLSMRSDAFRKAILDTLKQLWMILNDEDGLYYVNEFQDIRKLLSMLTHAKIDMNTMNLFLRESGCTNASLESFYPENKQNFAALPVYSQTRTATGRLTTVRGPNILTLKKSYRKILKSRYKNGAIVQVDFVSLEPRVLLSFLEKDCPRDIYKHVCKQVFGGNIDRQKAKILTLGMIYGLSSKSLADRLEVEHAQAKRYAKNIKAFFGLQALTKSLINSASSGKIKNVYGRHIDISRDPAYVIINRFVQSSAADAALLSFYKLVTRLIKKSDEIKPIFLIHDAILFDVSSKGFEILNNELTDGLFVPKFHNKFPVDIQVITSNKA